MPLASRLSLTSPAHNLTHSVSALSLTVSHGHKPTNSQAQAVRRRSHTVTSLQLSTLSTPFDLTFADLSVTQPSALLIFLAHGLTASLHLDLHFFLFYFLGSVRLNVSLCL